jgi:hypothetical protein
MKRKSEECQSIHALWASFRLRLRRHPPTKRFAAGNERKFRQQAQRRGHGGTGQRGKGSAHPAGRAAGRVGDRLVAGTSEWLPLPRCSQIS